MTRRRTRSDVKLEGGGRRKIRRIWWTRRNGSQKFRTRAAEVSSTAVRGGFGRFLMTPWNVCQNPSCYKNRAALAQAANRTRENFAAVTTRTSYAPRVVTGPENAVSQVERRH